MHPRLIAATLLVLVGNAFGAPPAAWGTRGCTSCHGAANANLQTWSGQLAGLTAGNFQDRLRAQAANSATMPTLANDDAAANGPADRAAILQYLLDARDGRITSSLALGTVTIGAATGNSGTVTITNERNRALTYSAPSITGDAGFSVTNESCGTRDVPAGGSCTLTVRFLPASGSAGPRSASLDLTLSGTGSDADPGGRSVALSGTAQPPLDITAGPLSFTAVQPNTSAAQTVTITNRLASDLRLCLIDAGGSLAAPADFNLVGRTYDVAPRCTTLTSPGINITQDVTFTPTADGPRFARLTARRVSGGSLLGTEVGIDLQGNAGPFITLQGPGLAGDTLFSGVRQDVDAGATAPTVVRVTNEGSTSLRFSSIAIPLVSGAASAEYAAGGCAAGSTLAQGAFCDLSLTFNPIDIGIRATQLQIAYADLADTPGSRRNAVILLRGQGTRGASLVVRDAGGTALASGNPIAFGQQNISISYTRRLTLANIGSDEGLVVSAPTIVPSGAGFDLVAPSGGCGPLDTGFTLAARTSCVVDVRFSPVAIATYAADLTLRSTPAVGATSVNFALALSGEGVDRRPTLAWQRDDGSALSVLDVPGVTAVGTTTPPQVSLRLANLGPGAAALRLLNVIGTDASSFALESSTAPGRCRFDDAAPVLVEGTSCSVVITFRPQTAGGKTANLQLVSTGTTPEPLEMRAQASGPAASVALEASPLAVAFGDVRVGAQSAPSTIAIANTGTVVAVVTAIESDGAFTVEPGSCGAPPFSLEPRASCTLSARFMPSSQGAASGSVRLQVSGAVAPVEVTVQGEGTAKADVSSGGCSLSQGRSPIDPTLWLLLALAVIALRLRRRRHEAANRA